MTQMSNLSVDTQLSVQTNVDELYASQYMASPSFYQFPTGENVDPEKLRKQITDLINNITNSQNVSLNMSKLLFIFFKI